MIILFQLLFSLFALFALYTVITKKREGLLGPKGFWFWVIFWCLAIVAVVWPRSTSTLAEFFGIGRGVDLIIYIALAVIFFLLFRLHVKIESIGRVITKVVREEAVNKAVDPPTPKASEDTV